MIQIIAFVADISLSQLAGLALIAMLMLMNSLFIGHFFIYRAYRRSVERALTLLKRNPNPLTEEMLLLEQAQSYLNAGNNEKAAEYYSLYLRKKPYDANVCFTVARLLSNEHPETALRYLERAAYNGHTEAREMLNRLEAKKSPADSADRDL